MGRTKKERKQRKVDQIKNRKLCRRYPFLIPRNRWNGKILWEYHHDKSTYPYCFTELDAMEEGWRKTFGLQMCEDIRKELVKHNFLHKYRIAEIKEKYGELRWYDFGVPKTDTKIWDIINYYTELSRHVCYVCGAPAEVTDDGGWLITMCPDCIKKMNERRAKWTKTT